MERLGARDLPCVMFALRRLIGSIVVVLLSAMVVAGRLAFAGVDRQCADEQGLGGACRASTLSMKAAHAVGVPILSVPSKRCSTPDFRGDCWLVAVRPGGAWLARCLVSRHRSSVGLRCAAMASASYDILPVTRHGRSLPEPAPCHAAMPRLPCRSLALPLRSEPSALKCRPGSSERRCHDGRPTSSSAVCRAV